MGVAPGAQSVAHVQSQQQQQQRQQVPGLLIDVAVGKTNDRFRLLPVCCYGNSPAGGAVLLTGERLRQTFLGSVTKHAAQQGDAPV